MKTLIRPFLCFAVRSIRSILATLLSLAAPYTLSAQPSNLFKVEQRTLREFYPSAPLRHQVHFSFPHRFLIPQIHRDPRLFFQGIYQPPASGDAKWATQTIQMRWQTMEHFLGLVPVGDSLDNHTMRRVTDLRSRTLELNGYPAVLVEMPKPEAPFEVYFLLAVLLEQRHKTTGLNTNHSARVYVLTSPIPVAPDKDSGFEISEWPDARNSFTVGRLSNPDLNEFLRAVTKRLASLQTKVLERSDPKSATK